MSGIFENLPIHRGAELPLRSYLDFCVATISSDNFNEFVRNWYLVVSASTVNSRFNKDLKLQVHLHRIGFSSMTRFKKGKIEFVKSRLPALPSLQREVQVLFQTGSIKYILSN